jgi:hypothetical protein
MPRGIKVVLLCWVIGFLATIGIFSLVESAPRLHMALGYPLFRIAEVVGVGMHDMGMIPLLLIFSPCLYGIMLVGCGWLALLGFRKFRGHRFSALLPPL